MEKYIHCINPLKKVVVLFLFLSITHLSVYATIAVTQVTHATVNTDVPGTSGAPTFNCDGAIDITADGNAGPFTFLWSDDNDTEDRTDLCPGTYYVTVTNAFGCTKALEILIRACDKEDPIQITDYQIIPINPTSLTGGGVNIELAPSLPGVVFTWRDENDNIVGTQQNLSGVGPGTYCLRISGICGGPIVQCYTIENCSYADPFLEGLLSFQTTPPCPKTANGAIDLTVNFGVPPHQFLWSNTATTEDISNLFPRAYQVKVTDSRGCYVSAIVDLKPDIEGLDATVNHYCSASAAGEISVDVIPSGNYSFSWSNGTVATGAGSTIANLSPGQYCVTVVDNTSTCSTTQCWTISEGIPANSIQIMNLSTTRCPENIYGNIRTYCDGQVELVLNHDPVFVNQGGIAGDFLFNWTGPDGFQSITTSPAISNLCQGDYTVTVTDTRGCTGTHEVNICCCSETGNFDPSCINHSGYIRYLVSPTITVPSISNNFKGSITVNTNNDLATPVFYTWRKEGDPDFIAHTQTITNLSPGRYCVTVTDGCANKDYGSGYVGGLFACYTISDGFSTQITRHTCPGGSNGAVEFRFTGTTPTPFIVYWGNNSQIFTPTGNQNKIFTVTGLDAGEHNFEIVDGNNVVYNASVTILERDEPNQYDGVLAEMLALGRPFSSDNACMKFWLWDEPDIHFNWNLGNDLFPNHTPLIIQWPDFSISEIKFDAQGNHNLIGKTNYNIGAAGGYNVRIIDQASGCRADYCFSFGQESVAASVAYSEYITLPGTSFDVNANVGCIGLKSCGAHCPTESSYSNDERAEFSYSPNNGAAPCSGGILFLNCSNPVEQFTITIPGYEFIDYDNVLKVNNDGTCNFKAGCLFEYVPHNIFTNTLPVYVELPNGIKLPCDKVPDPPGGGGTDPGSGLNISSCDGQEFIEVGNEADCRYTILCFKQDGTTETYFHEDFSTFLRDCKRGSGVNVTCYEERMCTSNGKIIYREVPCDPTFEYPECDYARPAGSRFSEDSENNNGHETPITLFPNPFTNALHLYYFAVTAGESSVRILDITGREITRSQITTEIGENSAIIELDNANITPGFYLFELLSPNGTRSVKKIVKKP